MSENFKPKMEKKEQKFLKIDKKSKKKLNYFLHKIQNFKQKLKKNKKNDFKFFLKNPKKKVKNYKICTKEEKKINQYYIKKKNKHEVNYTVANFSLLDSNISFNYLKKSEKIMAKKKFSINKSFGISEYLSRFKDIKENLKIDKCLKNAKLKNFIIKEKKFGILKICENSKNHSKDFGNSENIRFSKSMNQNKRKILKDKIKNNELSFFKNNLKENVIKNKKKRQSKSL